MVRDGFCTQAQFVRAIDGDTIELEVRRLVKVRLIHHDQVGDIIFDCAEKNTELGKKATDFVRNLLRTFEGKIRIFIPANDSLRALDSITFDRFTAEIWLDDKNLADILIENGYGRLIKRSERTNKPWS